MKLVLLHTILPIWKLSPRKQRSLVRDAPRGNVGIHSWVGVTSGVVDSEPLVTGDCLEVAVHLQLRRCLSLEAQP